MAYPLGRPLPVRRQSAHEVMERRSFICVVKRRQLPVVKYSNGVVNATLIRQLEHSCHNLSVAARQPCKEDIHAPLLRHFVGVVIGIVIPNPAAHPPWEDRPLALSTLVHELIDQRTVVTSLVLTWHSSMMPEAH